MSLKFIVCYEGSAVKKLVAIRDVAIRNWNGATAHRRPQLTNLMLLQNKLTSIYFSLLIKRKREEPKKERRVDRSLMLSCQRTLDRRDEKAHYRIPVQYVFLLRCDARLCHGRVLTESQLHSVVRNQRSQLLKGLCN